MDRMYAALLLLMLLAAVIYSEELAHMAYGMVM